MIDEKGGRIVAEIDHVAERVRPVAQALESISARIEDEKRVIGIQQGLMEELRAERVRRERWEEQRKRRRRYLWGSAAVLIVAILLIWFVFRVMDLLRALGIL